MTTHFKVLTATALAFCLPALALAPVSAKPIEQAVQPPATFLVAQVESMVGRIVSVSGTTVTVIFPNRQSQQYQVASSDFQNWQLAEGLFVLVEGDKIVDVARTGTIAGFSGSIFNVRLDQGGVVNVYVSRRLSGALNLRAGGTRVLIADGQIVALRSEVESLEAASMVKTNRTAALFQDGRAVTPAPLRTEPVRQPEVQVQERTVETKPEKPVRGLW